MISTLSSIAKTFGVSELVGKKHNKVVCDAVLGLDQPFEAARYMGNWFEIYHSKGEPFQPDSWTCSQATYSDYDAEKGTFKVYNSGEGRWNLVPRFGITGHAMCP